MSNAGRRAAAVVGVVVLVGVLLVAGLLGARALTRSTASDLIPLGSSGPTLPVVTGPSVRTSSWATAGNPTTRLAWTTVSVTNPGSDPVTITGVVPGGGSHDVRAVVYGLVSGDASGVVVDDSMPSSLGTPGAAPLEVPPGREALVVVGFTAACDASDSAFAPTATLALTSPSAGSGTFTIDGTDSDWARTARAMACTPALAATPSP